MTTYFDSVLKEVPYEPPDSSPTDSRLDIVRQLRALGANRITLGDWVIDFPVQLPTQQSAVVASAPPRSISLTTSPDIERENLLKAITDV